MNPSMEAVCLFMRFYQTIKNKTIKLELTMYRPISGGSMNPARSIGPAIASSRYEGIWVYMIGPITGTLLAAFSYNFIRATEKHTHSLSSH